METTPPKSPTPIKTALWFLYAFAVWSSGCLVLWMGSLREAPNAWMTFTDYPIWFRELVKSSYLRLVGTQVAQTFLIWVLAEDRQLGIRKMRPIIQWTLGLIVAQLAIIFAATLL